MCCSYNYSITTRALKVREREAEKNLSVSLPPPHNTMSFTRIVLHKMRNALVAAKRFPVTSEISDGLAIMHVT
jgi:hypothetical protein